MALLAIRLADSINGVSALHGEVSRKMWHNVWPQVSGGRSADPAHHQRHSHPHLARRRKWRYTLDRYLSPEWVSDPTDQSVWEGVMQIPDEEIWRAHERSPGTPGELGAADRSRSSLSAAAPATTKSPPPTRCSIPKR